MQENKFLDLYYTTHDALYLYTRRKIGEKTIAEDILQEAYCQAYRNKEKLESHPNPIGWLYQTVNFIARNYQRRKDNKVLSLDGSIQCEMLTVAEEGYELAEWKMFMYTLVSRDEMQLLYQYYIEQRSSEEIAQGLGITQENVRVRLYRIRRKVKKNLISVTKR